MARFNDRFIATAARPPSATAARPPSARQGAGAGSRGLLAAGSLPARPLKSMFIAALFLGALSLGALSLAGCSANPTPYQPLGEDGGYEESRLQQRIYRVSFKGNRHTRESDVLDFLFLRSAELTVKSGFTHFIIQQDYGRTQMDLQAGASGPRLQLGFGFSNRRSFWGLGFGVPPSPHYTSAISYHLAMFVIKMLKAEEAATHGDKAFHARFMIESLSAKKEKSLRKGS